MRQMFYVYCFQNKINSKIYIGKTNDPLIRLNRHLTIVKNGKTIGKRTFNLIHKAIKKYGIENFSYQILEEFDNEKDALEAEMFWIEFFRSDVNRFGNECGYNLTAGGDGLTGRKRSEEEKKKISNSLIGRNLTEEHRQKLSESHKGIRIFNQNTKISWPEDSYLLKITNDIGYTATGKMLGVSNVAVRERLKRRSLK